jgi:hypothetical protein
MKRVIDWRIILTVFVFTVATAGMVVITSLVMGDRSSNTRYYLNQYGNQKELFTTLVDKPDKVFLWCCDCILYYAKQLGITYEELNIHLFVIVQPMLVLMFMILFVIQSFKLRSVSKINFYP